MRWDQTIGARRRLNPFAHLSAAADVATVVPPSDLGGRRAAKAIQEDDVVAASVLILELGARRTDLGP